MNSASSRPAFFPVSIAVDHLLSQPPVQGHAAVSWIICCTNWFHCYQFEVQHFWMRSSKFVPALGLVAVMLASSGF